MATEAELIEARKTFPLFPEEVFQLWLDDRIRQNGWPPSGSEWQGFLLGQSIVYWQRLQWAKRLVTVNSDNLSDMAYKIAYQLYEASFSKKQTIMAEYIPNTRERYASIFRYVQEHQRLPVEPIILLQRNGLFDVVEGNHRVSVLLALQQLNDANGTPVVKEVEAWVASE